MAIAFPITEATRVATKNPVAMSEAQGVAG
jgi:hypothetical protein